MKIEKVSEEQWQERTMRHQHYQSYKAREAVARQVARLLTTSVPEATVEEIAAKMSTAQSALDELRQAVAKAASEIIGGR